jgi:inorganic pyrophosphatase
LWRCSSIEARIAGMEGGFMRVFVQNEAGSDQKHVHNEKTLEYKGTRRVSRPYTYPYGFILNTTSGDGDNLDCFVITDQELKSGDIVDCEPVGIMEVLHNGKEDHKILAVLNGEKAQIDREVKQKLSDFVSHIFDYMKEEVIVVGKFLGQEEAIANIQQCLDQR